MKELSLVEVCEVSGGKANFMNVVSGVVFGTVIGGVIGLCTAGTPGMVAGAVKGAVDGAIWGASSAVVKEGAAQTYDIMNNPNHQF